MHPDGDIWELRPLRDRILFAGVVDGKYVLLHQFMKKTQKTPAREIKKAKDEWKDFKESQHGVKGAGCFGEDSLYRRFVNKTRYMHKITIDKSY
ncbi:MAG: type II toxin-antitoxin system RelE/ParE family toxin [Lachnospiraceae bacterium]|nr:type II toxin-antitoxin system RelE/ParE family toxin [Lachnospiraceae bacterium]MBQ8845847.1 type II toxin-antitoxin system RelE/ParE family toxin [Lachnospiraceae bacterium]